MAAGEAGVTPALTRLRLPLGTMGNVKAELARLYRDGKAGRRDIAEVSKLANVLSILGRLIEGTETAAAIEAIEQELKEMRRK
ncbi:MAG: hypothetical protein J7598_03545 [Mitsuaria chitosanitabida]|nr:hypothetical protein [Roseateles chitosanitabidus]